MTEGFTAADRLVDEFLREYEREVDYYATVAALVQRQLEAMLRASGVRAIATSRAKRPDRLRAKLLGRATAKGYRVVEDIRADIPDFAGVRVALYFPGERSRVNTMVAERFVACSPPVEFPRPGSTPSPDRRFPGYVATHHRVHLREDTLSAEERRYAAARAEVQIASVLMHAWAEVEHDLVYKPLAGDLSHEEHSILDGLNGLVLTGEIALQQLEGAIERRVQQSSRRLRDQYDLAVLLSEHARDRLRDPDAAPKIGRADHLFALLRELHLDTPAALQPILRSVNVADDGVDLARQVVDAIIAGDAERYRLFDATRRADELDSPEAAVSDEHRSFVQNWIALEKYSASLPRANLAQGELQRLRALRDLVVHGEMVVAPALLAQASRDAEKLLNGAADEREFQS
jgi:ppGpp synthetase/RelA/SpoT-type nucleotidyltranferase